MAEKNQDNCTTGGFLVDSITSRELLEELLKVEIRQLRIRNLAAEESLIADARSKANFNRIETLNPATGDGPAAEKASVGDRLHRREAKHRMCWNPLKKAWLQKVYAVGPEQRVANRDKQLQPRKGSMIYGPKKPRNRRVSPRCAASLSRGNPRTRLRFAPPPVHSNPGRYTARSDIGGFPQLPTGGVHGDDRPGRRIDTSLTLGEATETIEVKRHADLS